MRLLSNRADNLVSIHAPAWGATYKKLLEETIGKSFNPRSRVGSDTRRGF